MAATDDKVGSSSSSSSSSRRSREGYGRKKIAMKKIEKNSSLRVTFSKRRAGLFKKASELSLLCGAEVAVITFSPGGKLFSFGNPSADAIIDRYMGGQVVERPEVEATRFWWEVPESELERMELTELESYGGELERFINKLRFRVMMESGSDDSGSNANQPGTWSTANSDILDIERMMMEEASVPECDDDDNFDWSFLFDENPNPSSVEDDSAACFNESISVAAETSSSSAATAMVEFEYPGWAASPECNNSFCFDNNSSNWNWGFGLDQNPLEDSGWCFN